MGSIPTGSVCRHLGSHTTSLCPRLKSAAPAQRMNSVSNSVAGGTVEEVALSDIEKNQAIREGHYENALVQRQVRGRRGCPAQKLKLGCELVKGELGSCCF